MKFIPKTAEEIQKEQAAFEPFPSGEYDFEVEDAVDHVSTAGNESIKGKINIYNAEGLRRVVFDYLNAGGGAYKFRHLCELAGLLADFENGEVNPESLVGHSGRCKVRSVPAKGGYPAKNEISDYIVPENVKQARPAAKSAPSGGRVAADLDDDIPFAACWQ